MLETLFRKVEQYSVLLVGDAILDEYVYVKPLAKSPKENLIPSKIIRSEKFRGGVWAAEAHVENFCKETGVRRGEAVTIKRRFVEEHSVAKLYEVHLDERHPVGYHGMPYDAFDLVLVTDFGHGAVTDQMIEEMSKGARFLAVNVQTNSANYGFNLITKYPRADYVVLDELEARLAVHDRDSPIERVVERLGFKRMVVTLGPMGAIGYEHGAFVRSEAISRRVVDTMGAGDAFFCVTAPFAAAGADMATILRIGNAAGAIKCAIVGHRQAVTREALSAAMA